MTAQLLQKLHAEFFFQKFRRMSDAFLDHLLRSAGKQKLSAALSAFGTHLHNVVSHLYHVEVVLDDNYRVAAVYKFVQNIHQHSDVFEMKSRRWLVEYVERLSGVALGKFGCQFYALALASREGC